MPIPTKRQKATTSTATNATAAQTAQKSKAIDTGQRIIVKETPEQFPLSRHNFILMIAGGLMILVGFLLMLGSGTTTEEFNPDIFSTRRIIIGPTIAFLGFVFTGIAIVIRPKK